MKSKPLVFPEKILDQHLVVLGKTGAGKSSALRHIVEFLLARKKRVCVIDPKGDWWGLKVGADGRSAGFPVVLFGDFKNEAARDVPINYHSGASIAELVALGNRPCVIGMRGWTQGGMTRFWIDFAAKLFALNAGELYLVGDEFHNFAPKQWKGVQDKDNPAATGLHWANRLLSEGRGLGLVCLIASQRPQKVHNDTLTSCETLVAMRVVHAADRGAVEDWIKGAGDPALGKEVLNSLAGMGRGEAFVWSPEAQFGPRRLAFPLFTTFDSFAPPQLQQKVSEQGWASVDLGEVEAKLATVIEQAKANDPKELKRQIGQLQKELAQAQRELPRAVAAAAGKVETQTVAVPVITAEQLERLQRSFNTADAIQQQVAELLGRFEEAVTEIKAIAHELSDAINEAHKRQVKQLNEPARLRPVAPAKAAPLRKAPVVAPTRPHNAGDNALHIKAGARRMLEVVAAHAQLKVTKAQLATLARMKVTGGTFGTYYSTLKNNGLIVEQGGSIQITQAGMDYLGIDAPPAPQTTEELLARWGRALKAGARAVSRALQLRPVGRDHPQDRARGGL